MIDDTTPLICRWWRKREPTFVKSISWFEIGKPRYMHDYDCHTAWWTRVHYTDDITDAIEMTRYEWVKAFRHSKLRGFPNRSHKLELPK